MSSLHAGHLVVQQLLNEGVKYIFSVSGFSVNPIYDATIGTPIKIIHTRHEAAAAFMADAWGRLTRTPGVVVVTQGPGVTNTVTGLLTAHLAASPLLVIGACTSAVVKDRGALQELDVLGVTSAVTKWAKVVPEAERIPEYVGWAYREAISGRPGPVFLGIPADMLATRFTHDVSHQPRPPRAPARPFGDPGAVSEALAILARAQKPVIVTGSGVWWADAAQEVRRLVEMLKIPVLSARMSRGVLSADDALYFGIAPIELNSVSALALSKADAILMLGGRFDYEVGYGKPPKVNGEAKVIQVDIEPSEIGKNRSVEVEIVGDARAVLRQMIAELNRGAVKPGKYTEWLQALDEERDRSRTKWDGPDFNAKPIHPLRLCREIQACLDRDAIIVTGGGEVEYWGRFAFKQYAPGTYLRAGQTGCLGAEIPYAIAAKLARPERQVLVLVGDGAFGYHGMEFDTASRYGIPIVCVVASDAAWGMIKHGQESVYGKDRVVGTTLLHRHYEMIAEALGGRGVYVNEPGQLKSALEAALESDSPACIVTEVSSVPNPDTSYLGKKN